MMAGGMWASMMSNLAASALNDIANKKVEKEITRQVDRERARQGMFGQQLGSLQQQGVQAASVGVEDAAAKTATNQRQVKYGAAGAANFGTNRKPVSMASQIYQTLLTNARAKTLGRRDAVVGQNLIGARTNMYAMPIQNQSERSLQLLGPELQNAQYAGDKQRMLAEIIRTMGGVAGGMMAGSGEETPKKKKSYSLNNIQQYYPTGSL